MTGPTLHRGRKLKVYRGQDGYSVNCPIERKRIATLFELYDRLERTTLSWERKALRAEIDRVTAIKTDEP
jgi:hypothetical protein